MKVKKDAVSIAPLGQPVLVEARKLLAGDDKWIERPNVEERGFQRRGEQLGPGRFGDATRMATHAGSSLAILSIHARKSHCRT